MPPLRTVALTYNIESYQTDPVLTESIFTPSRLTSGSIPTETKTSAPAVSEALTSVGGSLSCLLSEVSGVVVSLRDDFVQIKLGNNTFVDFPTVLFASKTFINVGQHVKYQVKKDQWGYRYQDLVVDNSVGLADTADLEALLKDI